jgi:hypothetical protein
MTKEQLMALGLTAEQADKVLAANTEAMKSFVPRARLDEETEKAKGLATQLAERDKDITTLKTAAGKGSDLEGKLTELQGKYDTDTKKLNEQLAAAKLDAALDVAILGAKGRNPKAVKALIDTSKLKLKDDGTVDGLDLAALQKSDPYLFAAEKTDPQGPGYTPPAGGDPKAQPKTLQEAVAQALQQQQQKG